MQLTREVDQYLSDKRYRKANKRRSRKEEKLLTALANELEAKARFGNKSKIIRMLANAYKFKVSPGGRELRVSVPKTFSIIEDPVNALHILQSFALAMKQFRYRAVKIDQSQLEIYDLAANALLDLVATEIELERKHNRSSLKFVGAYPTNPAVKRFIKSMGIVKHLKIKHEIANGDDAAKIRLFDKRSRHYFDNADPRKADFKARTIAGFVDHINNCLSDHRRVLTPASRHHLSEYLGEIISNAEEHPKFVDWTIQGYLDNSLNDPICEIAIFNFGRSIGESLTDLPITSYTRKQIEVYLMLHAGQGLFGSKWRKVDLLTLMALQGNVSSKNHNVGDDRGQGTVDLIDFFQRVYKECAENSGTRAKMAILSGSTYILFDGTYTMREVSARKGKVIAFNEANNLYQKPNSKYVRSLGSLHFPGTIISIRFPLSTTSTVTLGEN
jgi:hypothetical protein